MWCLGGKGPKAKQLMTFSVSVKQKKARVFLHIDLTIFTKAIKRAYIQSVVVQSIKHAAPTERDRAPA